MNGGIGWLDRINDEAKSAGEARRRENAQVSESWVVQRGTRGRWVRFARLDARGIEWVTGPADATHYPAEELADNLAAYLASRFSSLRFRVVAASESLTSELRP